MYAPQPSHPPEHVSPPARRTKSRPRPVRSPYRGITLEVSAKIAVNVCLVVVSGIALLKLIPYTLSQRAQLEILQAEVTELEQRTTQLRVELNTYFDSNQTQRLAQEEGQWLRPSQRRVVWLEEQPGNSSGQVAQQ